MRVLVTGAEGYIGSLLAPLLAERGHDVVGLDTGFYADAALYDAGLRPVPTIRRDIRGLGEADLAGFDAVVHLAELSNDPLGQLNPDITFRINHLGSVALAEAARRAGVSRFVYTSSCSVYGVGTGDLKDETSAPDPQTAYAECKVLVERDVSALAADGFSPVFLRNATAYGASPRMRFDLVVNNLSGLAWTTGEIRMTSDGSPWRPLVHVADICEAVAAALEAPREAVHGEIFNVGDSQENYQVRDVARVVADVFPGCSLTFGSSDGDNRSYRVSFDKIAERLPAFRCRRDVQAGAEELRGIFERIAMTPEVFEHRTFTRLKQLQHLLGTEQVGPELFWLQEAASA
ncbi:MAG TPA: SDR family oxidoreductase [Longimicrobiaceae bacterium]|nr:SDR family oxidoreductase [Longimicrobiaceae bacterium]